MTGLGDQLELPIPAVEQAPVADPPPAWLGELTGVERSYRERVLAERGPLARALRTVEGAGHPVPELLELWRWMMSLRTSLGLAAHTTVARYVEIVARYLRWCVERELDYRAVTHRDIDTWQKSLFMERRSGVSWRKLQLQALRSLYDWRDRMGFGPNCTRGVRSPKTGIRTARKYTAGDLAKLMQQVDKSAHSAVLAKRDLTLMMFLYATGARRDECGALRLDQLELGRKIGTVRFLGKGSKERMVSFEGPLVTYLSEWLIERDHHRGLSDAVFWSTDHAHGNWGQRLSASGVERLVKRYARAAGLGSWGVHRFRVTYATQLYDAGTDIERIRIALGHESIETTRRYLALSDRQTSTRLPAHNQWAALGKRNPGQPLWVQQKEGTL